MSKRSGRPRKVGHREPNGQLSRAQRQIEPALAPAAIKALLASDLRIVQSLEYGTHVGRMMLDGKLTPLQWAAAKKWDRIADAYRQALCSPRINPKSPDLEPAGGTKIDPDTEAGARAAKRERIAREAFEGAMALVLTLGRHTLTTVRECCEGMGRPCAGYEDLLRLQAGLSLLAAAWQLTEKPNGVRNALSKRAAVLTKPQKNDPAR